MKTAKAMELFLTNCELRGLSVRTIKTYKQQLSYLAQAFPKLPTTPEAIETLLARIDATPETKHSYFRTYRAAYNFLDKRHKTGNPMLNVTAPRLKPKVMPTLEMSDIGLLPIFIKNSHYQNKLELDRDMALISLLLDTSIRSSEATGLKREDIKEHYIKVKGKVGERIVPISDSVVKLLLELPNYEDGYIFHGHRGKMTRSGAYLIVKRALQRIGIKGAKCGPHRLRHTFGRQYLVLGGDLRSLQIIMGHSNIQTTEKYASLSNEDVMQKHNKYTPWDNYLSEVDRSEKVTMSRLVQYRR